jgi:hypothetical protein
MRRRTDVAEIRQTGGVILRDDTGHYYAIPRAALARFQVSELSRTAVEAFLDGNDDWTVRTGRRSNDLWLISG